MTTEPIDDAEPQVAAIVTVFVAVAALLWAISVGLALVLPSDPGPVSSAVADLFIWAPEYLRPEPTERLIFLVDMLLLPVFAMSGAWVAARQRNWKEELATIAPLVVALAVARLASDMEFISVFRSTETVKWFATALVAAIACLVFSQRGAAMGVGTRVGSVAFAVASLLVIYFAFTWRTLDVPALQLLPRHEQHLDAVLFTISQAAKGRVPLADFSSQYGFFCELLAPWFKLIGLSVVKVTATLNALYVVALLAVVAAAYREFKHWPFAIGACLTVLWIDNAWFAMSVSPDPYFQYAPVRLLFPATSLLLVSMFLRQGSMRRAVLISLFAGVALVWNLDTGVAVAGSWVLLLAYQAWAAALANGDWRSKLKIAAVSSGAIAIPPLAFMAWIRLRAGAPVDFGAVIDSQRLFYGTGFFMMPMPTGPDLWHVVAAALVFGLVLGVVRAAQRQGESRASLILYLSILGLGLFPYYQGRSHHRVLMWVAWPAMLIVFLVADWAWDLGGTKRLRRWIAASVALPALVLGALSALLLVHDIPGVWRRMQTRWAARAATPGLIENIDFVRDATRGRPSAVVLARFQGVYFAETGLASSIRGAGEVEVITRAQSAAIVSEIERTTPDLIFIGMPHLVSGDTSRYAALMPLLAQRYTLVSSTTREALQLYRRRDTR